MATQTLRDASKNVLPVRAARFFLKEGQINPERENELFEEHWTINKVAETLIVEAIEVEPWLKNDLLTNNISLSSLLVLDKQSINIIFTQLYPLLEPLLLRGLLDPFYDNADVDPQVREERATVLARLNAALDAPAELIGEPPLFVRRAYERAETLITATKVEFVVRETVARIVDTGSGVTIDQALSAHLARRVFDDPEVTILAGKINGLPEDQANSAFVDFEKLLLRKLQQEAEIFSTTISPESNPNPLTVQLETPTVTERPTPSHQIAGRIVDDFFKLVPSNDKPVLVGMIEEELDSPTLDSPIPVQDQSFRELFARLAINTVANQVAGLTGRATPLTDGGYSDLFTKVNEQLDGPWDEVGPTLAETIVGSFPTLTTQQRPQVLVASQRALREITVAQTITASPDAMNTTPRQVTIEPNLLRAIGQQISESSPVPVQIVEQPRSITINIDQTGKQTRPTASIADLSQQLATHLFPSANTPTPIVIQEIANELNSPIIETPSSLAQHPEIIKLTVQTVIKTITDQASAVTGQTANISSNQLRDVVGHLSDLLAIPNENTTRTISLAVTDVIPNLSHQQKGVVVSNSTGQLSQLTLAQLLIQSTPLGTQAAQTAVISADVLGAIGKQVTTTLEGQLATTSVVNMLSPQFTQTVLLTIPDVTAGSISKTDAVSQIAGALNSSIIDPRKAEEIVMTYSRFTEGLKPQDYQHNLSIWRDNAMLAVAASGLTLKPDEVAKIVDILSPAIPLSALPPQPILVNVLSEPAVIYISPKLSSLLKQLPSTTSPLPETSAGQTTLFFKKLLLDQASRQLTGRELIEARQEINLLFAKPNPRLIAELNEYLSLPEDQRGTIIGVRVNKHTATAPQVYISQPGREPKKTPPSMAEILAKTPGSTKKLNQLQEIRNAVYRFGTNSEIGLFIRRQVTRAQALSLMSRGVNEEDLTRTQSYLQQRGPKRNLEAIRELQDIQNEMALIRRENPRFSGLINRLRGVRERQLKSGYASPIRTPFSRFETAIRERNLFNPRLWQAKQELLLRKIFGVGDIIVRGRVTQVNRLVYYRFKASRFVYGQISRFPVGRAYLRFTRRFSQGGLEKLLKSKIGTVAEASFKKFAGTAAGKAFAQTTAKFAASTIDKAVVKALPAILAKLGITVAVGATGPIGWAVAAVVHVATKIIGGLFKGIKKGLVALGNLTHSFVFGMANADDIKLMSDNTKNFMIAGAVGFVIIFLPVILIGNIISGAFLQVKGNFDAIFGPAQPSGVSDCFVYGGNWTVEEINTTNEAIVELMKYPKYYNVLCPPNKQVKLIRAIGNNWCEIEGRSLPYNPTIIMTNKCVGSLNNTLYSLTHETGHIYAYRSPAVYVGYKQAIGPIYSRNEDFICSYPIPPRSYSEDFPEMIAVYAMNKFNLGWIFPGGCNKAINLQTDYPIHYTFTKDTIF